MPAGPFVGDSAVMGTGMIKTEERLTSIGFGKARSETQCWRAQRIGRPFQLPETHGPEPACSAALLRWREMLARATRAAPYVISRV